MRRVAVIILLSLISTGVVAMFWYNELIYSIPTPVPTNYQQVDRGDYIDLTRIIDSANTKPVLLHFFNPDCPCSRFNIPHFKALVKKYSNDVNFVVVPLTMLGKHYSEDEIKSVVGLDVPVLFDSEIASLCGVYSTPQAVIINTDHTLYYRGNYNKSRYCTDKKSNFAQMAIDSLIHHNVNPDFSPLALKAYGCQVPGSICKK